MRHTTGVLRCAALALLALLALSGSAGAVDATISPAGAFTLVSNGRVTFDSPTIDITCNETMRGTLTREIAGVESGEAVIGSITSDTSSSCSGGSVAALELPTELIYRRALSEMGVLIGLLVEVPVSAIEADVIGNNCLYLGFQGTLWPIAGSPPEIPTVTLLGTVNRLFSGPAFLCPPTIAKLGTFDFDPDQEIGIS